MAHGLSWSGSVLGTSIYSAKGETMKNSKITIVLLCAVGSLTALVYAAGNHPAKPTKIRIGTFKSQALAVAYFRSDVFRNYVNDLKAQTEKAQADGDEERTKQLKAKLQDMQQTAHMQVFGNAGINNILKHIEGAFPEVAAEADLAAVVQQVLYSGPSVELVDVTDLLVKKFDPDEETLKAIRDL